MGYEVGDKVFIEGKVHSLYNGISVVVEINGKTVLVDRKQVRPIDESRLDYTNGHIDGMNATWETARLICNNVCDGGISTEDLETIFGTMDSAYIMRDNTASEAATKIAEWEEKQKTIYVGDVVQKKDTTIDAYNGVVITSNNNLRWVLWEDGQLYAYDVCELKKTNRTINIDDFLKQIGGQK